MTTDITELAQSLKNAASKALIEEGMTWFSEEQLSHEDGIALHKADAEFMALASPANILALVEALEKAWQRIAQVVAERDALREGEIGNAKHSNTRAAADIYFQLAEECDIPAGGSLVEFVDGLKERVCDLESRTVTVKLPVSLDFDCEMENGDYDIDEEPYLRGKVDGFNYALTKVRRLNGTTGIKWEAE